MNCQTASTNPSAPSLSSDQTSARCIHRSPSGRRCQSEAVDPQASFCRRHLFGSTRRYPDPSLASELLGNLTEFQSAGEVNQFLSRLLLLLAQDRLSPRRGAVMAYTCNPLLRSLHAIDVENKIAADAPQEIIFDLVRPKRDDPSSGSNDPPHPPLSHPTWHSTATTAERPQT